MSDISSKIELRRRLRAQRAALAAALPDAAAQAANLLPLERVPAHTVFAAYHPMGSEMGPGPLSGRLIAAGCQLALPVAESREAPLTFRAWHPGEALVPDALGVLAPPPSAASLRPDLVITPLLAFDRQGGRLGQGGGHYDRTLAALRASGPVFVLGLAYAGQEVDPMELEAHDQRLDAILTETGYRELKAS